MRRLLIVALALSGLLVAGSATTAAARPSLKKSIWGPVERDGRSQFPLYHDLGAGIWQQFLYWHVIAPARPADPQNPDDPAYAWPQDLDRAVRDARRYQIRICLQIARSPPWANGGHNSNWAPRRSDFVDFVVAASRRYPSVRLWMIWGEPSKQANFEPMTPETRGSNKLTAAQSAAPRRYARLLDAAYGALKRIHPDDLVIGGNTFTVGDISPYNWLRYMKLPNGRRPRMDLYGHNPFTSRRPDLSQPSPPPGPDQNFSDFSDLDTFVHILDINHYRDSRGRRLRLFLSEFFFPTDHANWEFPFHVSHQVQASWLSRALRIVRRWSRIYSLGWLSLYDDPPRADGLEVNRGLISWSGRRKAAYQAFKLG